MKITKRDNGTAKLLFMKHERDIFRGVGGMSHFPHLPETTEHDTVAAYQAGIGFSSLSLLMDIPTSEFQCLQRTPGAGLGGSTEVSGSLSHTL